MGAGIALNQADFKYHTANDDYNIASSSALQISLFSKPLFPILGNNNSMNWILLAGYSGSISPSTSSLLLYLEAKNLGHEVDIQRNRSANLSVLVAAIYAFNLFDALLLSSDNQQSLNFKTDGFQFNAYRASTGTVNSSNFDTNYTIQYKFHF